MPRTRLIRPGFFRDADLYDAEVKHGLPLRVAFAGLWTVADREGRFAWKPREIKPDVLPFDAADMITVLDALRSEGFIQAYVVDGREYGLIPGFADHQTFHKTEPASRLPAPVVEPLPHREATVVERKVRDAVAVRDTDTANNTSSAREQLLSAVPDRQAWEGEIQMCQGGARGQRYRATAEQVETACRDYLGNGASRSPNMAQFRAYIRRAVSGDEAPPARRGGTGQRTYENTLAALKDLPETA